MASSLTAKSIVKRILILGTISLAITTASLWNRGLIQKWIRARIVTFYVQKVQPNLPFTIEEAEFDAGWRDLWNGKLTRLSLKIRYQDFVFYIDGPIDISRAPAPENYLEIAYRTETRVERGQSSTPVHIELNAHVASNLRALEKISVAAAAQEFKWQDLKIIGPELYVESPNRTDFSGQISLEALYVERTDLMLKIPKVTLNVFGDPKSHLSGFFEAQDGELLKGSDYFSLPLAEFPLQFKVENPMDPVFLSVRAGKTNTFHLQWQNQMFTADGKIPAAATFLALTETALSKKLLPESMEIKGGKLAFAFKAQTPPLKKIVVTDLRPLPQSTLSLEKLKIRHRNGAWLFPNVSLTATPEKIEIAPLAWQVKNWQGKLAPLTVFFKETENRINLAVRAPQGKLIQESSLPITLTDITGDYDFKTKNLDLQTSFELAKTPWQKIRENFCLGTLKEFPAEAEIHFPKLNIFNDTFDPTGSARVSVFGGFIEISDFGFYDFTKEVPEMDFDLRIDEIRMDQIDAWAGFGEMDGYFQATVDDAVLQGWLPTQYQAWAQIKPHHHKQIVFSAEAMRNLVKVFAADAIDQIPKIAQWFAFGWPSAVFGGYDIQYAGLKLHSKDAQIKIETLDPPDVYTKERQHYFLYGPRFKMPLRSFHYPLIVDATAMGNFVRQITLTLKEIMRNKKKDHSQAEEKNKHDDDENEFGPCLVPEL